MTVTLTFSATTLTLPADLLWADEYAWKAVEQRSTRTITGALILEAYAKQSGRPITLVGANDYAWLTRTQLEQLRTWALVPGRVFSLVLRSEAARTVVMDHEAGAIEAQQINYDYDSTAASDQFAVRLRFLEV